MAKDIKNRPRLPKPRPNNASGAKHVRDALALVARANRSAIPASIAAGAPRQAREPKSDRRNGITRSYLRMCLNPFGKDAARYPDETLHPTALVHLQSSMTYITTDSTFSAGLSIKVVDSDVNAQATTIVTPGRGPIPDMTIRRADYGGQQASWGPLCAVDRTLAAGLRLRITGLPPSTFAASGTLYFLQLQADEVIQAVSTFPLSETNAITAVQSGKGFCVTAQEIFSSASGVYLPYLPQGPMSYNFSDHNALADQANIYSYSQPSTPVAPKPFLYCIGYGLQAGVSVRVDYAHHVEYIPGTTAAGLVAALAQPPSGADRESIATSISRAMRGLFGATTAKEVLMALGEAVVGGVRIMAGDYGGASNLVKAVPMAKLV